MLYLFSHTNGEMPHSALALAQTGLPEIKTHL